MEFVDGSLLNLKNRTDTCSFDVAAQGAHTLEEVGEHLGITREGVRQIEKRAFRKLFNTTINLALDWFGEAAA